MYLYSSVSRWIYIKLCISYLDEIDVINYKHRKWPINVTGICVNMIQYNKYTAIHFINLNFFIRVYILREDYII